MMSFFDDAADENETVTGNPHFSPLKKEYLVVFNRVTGVFHYTATAKCFHKDSIKHRSYYKQLPQELPPDTHLCMFCSGDITLGDLA